MEPGGVRSAVSTGTFAPDAHLQLIDGEIVKTAPQRAAHVAAVRAVEEALRSVFSTGHDVRVQAPLALLHDSEPEPDVAVVHGSFRNYRDHHPERALLVAEVSDTSFEFDRTRKTAMYARGGVPEYWIVNLVDRQLEVYRDPREGTYVTRQVFTAGDVIAPVAGPGAHVQVASLMP